MEINERRFIAIERYNDLLKYLDEKDAVIEVLYKELKRREKMYKDTKIP